MENETPVRKTYLLPASIFISALIIAGAWIYTTGLNVQDSLSRTGSVAVTVSGILPQAGITLPVRWGDFGVQMVRAGVIDKAKFEALYAERGGLSNQEKKLLEDAQNRQLVITESNSGLLLNLLWALGLGTKNDILESGPMMKYGGKAGAGNFASTGGWTIARGDPMNHYSRHPFIVLTSDQQKLVERVSKNIYRPCCGNSTYFPDCNHGMAMLGLLELMVSQGVSETEMYKAALQVNKYWFPDTYSTIAQYFVSKGIDWGSVDPKEILGAQYSSGQGYRKILEQLPPQDNDGGGNSCAVKPAIIPTKRSGNDCAT